MAERNERPGQPEPGPNRWQVDLREVMFIAGLAVALAGAAMIHVGLAVVVAGLGLTGAAWFLAKRRGG